MKSPFENIEKAFEPFYNDEIVVETKGGERQTVRAFLATDNTADTLDENMMESNQEAIQITFPREVWPYVGSLKRGDRIIKTDKVTNQEREYVVQDVLMDFALGFVVKARSI